VGHTGNLQATIKAVECVDKCLGEIWQAVQEKNGALLVTADHGNADSLIDKNNNPDAKHTTNRVPFIMAGNGLEGFVMKTYEQISKLTKGVTQEYDKHGKPKEKHNGCLANIAATVLEIMGIEKPKEMTHPSLCDFTRHKSLETSLQHS
jgi:2,3-bisphosphoglycerate-independent phosphoglycerate mutase